MAATKINLKQAVVTTDFDFGSNKLTGLAAPTNDNDAARKVYVDTSISAIDFPVDTVFGRTGAVVATNGDYTAAQVTNTPAGTIAAVTVQAAIDELDTDKLDKALTTGFVYFGVAGVATARRQVVRETPTTSDNTEYTLAYTPVAGQESVFVNGLLMEPGAGADYTIAAKVITFLAALAAGDKVRVSYLAAD